MAIEEIDLYYLTSEDLLRYLPQKNCRECGQNDCRKFADLILSRKARAEECPHLGGEMARVMDAMCALDIRLVESDSMMQKVPDKLVEMNSPDSSSPVLLTSSSIVTIDILKRILTAAGSKAFIVPVDTMGYTLDNSVHENTLTQMGVMKALNGSMIGGMVSHRSLFIPGLAADYKSMVERISRWMVSVGPVSGFELPMFFIDETDK
ncbi:MAG: hypothetical protein E4H30_03655 [Methanomassiliicoccus sp.]|nr:MAG: hypothetical protein E4H30_03655 [Methanomassiliicoccus sp.]